MCETLGKPGRGSQPALRGFITQRPATEKSEVECGLGIGFPHSSARTSRQIQ